MSKTLGYSIVIREGDFEDGDRFEGRVLELPNVLMYAKTFEECYLNTQDVIKVTLESFTEDGRDMPKINSINDLSIDELQVRNEKLNHDAEALLETARKTLESYRREGKGKWIHTKSGSYTDEY
jgi:predicted RNase H-like HicB family nuclease